MPQPVSRRRAGTFGIAVLRQRQGSLDSLACVMLPSTLRVFIASPADAADERKIAHDCVTAVSAQLDPARGIRLELVGWEIVRGTAQRPQEAINELIDSCDFMICVLKRSWGSDPGGAPGFTSGTEEELFTALLGLGRRTHRMRDVWLAFIDVDDADPRIHDLKRQIHEKHALLYETISSPVDFWSKLQERLRGWAKGEQKVARSIDLVPQSGRDILGADRLRRKGEQLVDLGQVEQGEKALQQAADLGGPPESIAYARFLARQGRIEQAHAIIRESLDQLFRHSPDLESPSVAETYAYQANLLRREKKYFEAKQRLAQALDLLNKDDEYTRRIRSRILDDLGLAHHGAREYADALTRFEESRAIRLRSGEPRLIAQSSINLARTNLALGRMDRAESESESAVEILRALTPGPLHANALLLRAQVLQRADNFELAAESATMSLALNEQLGNTRGMAIAHNVLAQIQDALGDRNEARRHARACVDINTKMGSRAPIGVLSILEVEPQTETVDLAEAHDGE